MNTLEAMKIANKLMSEHGLDDWTFAFDRSVRRFGCTHYSIRQISLSRALTELNDVARVTNTILHEIAHALCGRGVGHGYQWRIMARNIGCDAQRAYNGNVVATPTKKFVGECPGCGKETRAHKRTKIACRECCIKHNHGRFSAEYLFEWRVA